MARERVVEAHFNKKIKKFGGKSIKLLPAEAGIPDRLVLLPHGRTFLVELKAEGGRLRPAQRVWHARAAQLGIQVVVLYGKKGVDRWLEQIIPPTR